MAKEKTTGGTRGERLRRLRKAKGLSLEQVHQITKIHVRVINALEEDKIDEISPVYVKGLLKIYCNLLGADPKDFTEEPSLEPPKTEDQKPQELPLAKPRIDISVIRNHIKLKPVILSICLLVLAMSAFRIGRSISIHRRQSQPEKSPPEPVAAVSKKVETPPASASTINNPRLGIRAKQNCWLEIKSDGKTIFKGILKKGDFEYWEAEDKIEFSLGNAGGVDVEINGKLLPPLGRRGQVIRNISVTKQGLTVPK